MHPCGTEEVIYPVYPPTHHLFSPVMEMGFPRGLKAESATEMEMEMGNASSLVC